MIRIVLLFLVVMAIIGLLGKWRRGNGGPRVRGRGHADRIEPAVRCPHCGTYLIGGAACDCRSGPPGG
jgi:hypothetical protein